MSFYPDILKVVLFGPQNTGKTTLCEALARHYKTAFVPEYSRIYAEQNTVLNAQTILPIAEGQLKLEEEALQKSKKLLFFDTNLLETSAYANLYYNEEPSKVNEMLVGRSYDLYLLPQPDVKWINDGVRDLSENRENHYLYFKSILEAQKADYYELFGSFSDRLNTAIQIIDKKQNKRDF